MLRSKIVSALLVLCCMSFGTELAGAAVPGQWYQVKNYVGDIGSHAVHVSLQTFGWIDHGSPGEWQVVGNYYYDSHRLPIALVGTRTPNGEMTLCEANPPDELQGQPVVPQGTKEGSNNCQFHISVEGLSATGQWVSPAKTLPINLHQVAYLDGTDDNHFRFGGPLEIPMWYHTKKDLLVGIYTTDASDEDCLLSMTALRLVNVKTGAIDRVIEFDCGAGTIATVIYSNVFKSETPGSVVVELMGGDHGMGQDSDVKLSH